MTVIPSLIFLIMSLFLLSFSMFMSIEIPFLNISTFSMNISFMLDWMSCLFLSTVLFISSMILMFSLFYIPNHEQPQFSLMLIMFVLSMSILILSDNIIFILLGWDGLGLSSYILVIYYQNSNSASSGMITILSNRIGDIFILMSIGILMMSLNWNFQSNTDFSLLSLILIMSAACTKSAQFPFSAWLPAAMAAPTPISALVHSSTLVTAGIFLMIRSMSSFHPSTAYIILFISSITAIFSGLSANWEQDMKKIIAMSTLSQIAMMMFALSIKATNIAFFHLITHALFKSTMFLCAGIIIHNSTYQDMRHIGSSTIHSPMTTTILGMSSMALMGIPFMSGFFSKDAIMEFMLSSTTSSLLSFLMIFSVGLTASYSIRMISNSTTSIKSKPDNMIHHSFPANMPIFILAPFSILMGSTMTWLSYKSQIFTTPNHLKLFITLTIILGLMTGMSLSFKQKKYMKMGFPAITLWFSHTLSTYSFNPFNKLMSTYQNTDKSWQEKYGPQHSYLTISQLSTNPDTITITMLFMLTIYMIIPITIMML